MEEEFSFTRPEMIAALREWDRLAKTEGWPQRDDEQQYADTADFLIDLLRK